MFKFMVVVMKINQWPNRDDELINSRQSRIKSASVAKRVRSMSRIGMQGKNYQELGLTPLEQ